MKVLLPTNETFELDNLSDSASDIDIFYAVLDNSDSNDPDYRWIPLVYMEGFSCPTIKLQIGKHIIQVPIDWQILIGEPDHGEYEVINLTSLNDRNFKAFVFNPLSSYRPDFQQIDIIDVYADTRWFLPRLKSGHLICVPLTNGSKPPCVYFIKDAPKSSEVILAGKAW